MSKKKIVRVFEVGAPLSEASPASQSATQRPALLQKIEKMLGLSSGEQPPEPKADDGDHHGLGMDGESSTEQVLGRLFTYPGDSKRVVMFVNDANLKSSYLTSKGPDSISKMVDKADWKRDRIQGHNVSALAIPTPELDVEDLLNNPGSKWGPNAVLLNVKKPVWDEFVNAVGPEQKAAAFAKAIDHKNYVGVLNLAALRQAGLPFTSDEERLDKFDVRKYVKGYPLRAVIDAAREEWNDKEANSPNEQAVAVATAVERVVKQAIKYIYSSVHKGKLKTNITPKTFDEKLRTLITSAPEIKKNEELIGLVQKEIMNKVKADNYPVGNLLNGLGQADIEQTTPAPAEPEKEVKKDAMNVDMLDAQSIADKLAQDKTKAKAVLKALRGYHID